MECINFNAICIGKNGRTFKIQNNRHVSEVKCKQSLSKSKYCHVRLSKRNFHFHFDIKTNLSIINTQKK